MLGYCPSGGVMQPMDSIIIMIDRASTVRGFISGHLGLRNDANYLNLIGERCLEASLMKVQDNCSRCGQYAKLENGLCKRCRREEKEGAGDAEAE